jgi:phosphate transport system substrate-binding protein
LHITNNIAILRDLYIINCQGYSGLGWGFAICCWRYWTKIILKSGAGMPGRNIIIKSNNIDEKNDNECEYE